MPLTLRQARPEDADAIGRITAVSCNHPSQLLKYGKREIKDVIDDFAKLYRQDIESNGAPILVVCDDELDGAVISFAQWTPPDLGEHSSFPKTEHLAKTQSEFYNAPYIFEFFNQLDALQERTLKGRKAYGMAI